MNKGTKISLCKCIRVDKSRRYYGDCRDFKDTRNSSAKFYTIVIVLFNLKSYIPGSSDFEHRLVYLPTGIVDRWKINRYSGVLAAPDWFRDRGDSYVLVRLLGGLYSTKPFLGSETNEII